MTSSSSALSAAGLQARARVLFPGLVACAVVGAAATFLSQHYGAPVMLFALLLGMAMNFLSEPQAPCLPGIELASRVLLRTGVALLGLRITFGQVADLGLAPVLLVVASVLLTIAASVLLARLMGFSKAFGVLTGGAVAICGASAALALSTVLPQEANKERSTLFTVIGVSALSTIVMIGYPMLAHALGLSPRQTGIYLGATIHDVAQVVGAGYGISGQVGDIATLVKLLRVAMLVPVMIAVSAITRRRAGATEARTPLLPWFVIAFALLVVIGSMGWVPPVVKGWGDDASRWCLVIAIAGIGMKTRLQELVTVGVKPVLLMVGQTVFLALLVLGLLALLR